MKKIGLILSLFLLSSCVSRIGEFPVKRLFVTDLANGVCAEYEITDAKNLKFELKFEHALLAGGDCDRLVGFHRDDFNTAKNWIRDAIKEGERCNQ